MLNKSLHRLHLLDLIKTIYADNVAGTLLGFKGGTAAYLIYGLPRFSVDLDFDLLTNEENPALLERLDKLFAGYEIKDKHDKRYTLFYLLSYGEGEHNIKVEISKRISPSKYELQEVMGISVRAIDKPSMFAAKLSALTNRARFASRDVFDIRYFASNKWDINPEVVDFYTGLSVTKQLEAAIELLQIKKDSIMLEGLGELVDQQKKDWIRGHLRTETIQLLKSYAFSIE